MGHLIGTGPGPLIKRVTIPANALLDENGKPILDENGNFILIDK